MDSDENEQPSDQTVANHNQSLSIISKLKPFSYYIVPILFLSLAIFFTLAINNFPKTHRSKPTPSSDPKPCLLWMSPFLSGGGYSSEGWSYISALYGHVKDPSFRISIRHHGDSESIEFWEGLPAHLKSLALDLHATECRPNETVVVCHSEPGAWNPPLFETSPCPPTARRNYYKAVIGRTMFETDRVSPGHVARCNGMDYVWVPTEFHVDAFVSSGVDRSKVVKIVQSVDVEFFDPVAYEPMDLESIGNLVLGSKNPNLNNLNPKFVFLSVFKWEYRKGWDILLRSYLEEFSADDDVALFLLTNPYHSDRDFGNKVVDFVHHSGLEKPLSGWAPVHVIDRHVAQSDLPRVYKAADAFVLPTRGEGWGRPIVEAMAMELPVIATYWSGTTEYMTEENSYPLGVGEGEMSEVRDGPFKGHLWAEPPVGGLRARMRSVVINPNEAKRRGKRAREDMVRRFSPEIVAGIVADRVRDLFQSVNVL